MKTLEEIHGFRIWLFVLCKLDINLLAGVVSPYVTDSLIIYTLAMENQSLEQKLRAQKSRIG
jgi:hypothetical protein